ncbi:MAG: NAD(+) synthase [candidate division Zixibacteria bacterium CG_4_9_14_3_um_filter_46_8]|nr:MAG: NAD(+) synthase [candidate division Zixibacteria bacterium CG_4_9_14_3_um_filter_46_8]
MDFSKDSLKLNCENENSRIVSFLKEQVNFNFKRAGAVVGISGGIDSSVVAALCASAFGPEKVLGISMPEKESSPDSSSLASQLAKKLGINHQIENITPILEGAQTYKRRDDAIRELIPQYSDGWKCKIVLPQNLLEKGGMNFFSVVVESSKGESISKRLPPKNYLKIVAASNFKQRTRMMTLYYYAEQLNYAVIGTGNKNEHEQGFFVKYGDGGADVKPIAHLYKTQVFQLGRYLGVPEGILTRTPTTDTYSAEVTQEEFFFRLNFQTMDLIWYAMENRIPQEKVAAVLGLSSDQIERAQRDISQKYRNTEYLRAIPAEV